MVLNSSYVDNKVTKQIARHLNEKRSCMKTEGLFHNSATAASHNVSIQ
jgi:hypothetical protein